ncbi:GntR family transcriptional regulator [Microvirga roseola]|uniref:GntR family transcriptional regulator n=1 Tax=Microvirga roseola TaxID=2883126 RepID=UPI001E3D48F5|nr:GntR family transcriptional regulator [Microvirga roseola]
MRGDNPNSKSRAVTLRDAVETEIVTGALKAGERLDEVQLAARFGVSRTPVREALHQLAASGLIEMRPRRGAVVAQVSPDRLVEMFEVMAELEGMCARLASRRLSDQDKEALLLAHRKCQEAAHHGDADKYYYENERFHHVVYRASRNQFLAAEAIRLHNRLKPYRRLQLRIRGRITTSIAEHEQIVTAILDGQGAAAQEHARAHIVIQGERFADLMASLNHLDEVS